MAKLWTPHERRTLANMVILYGKDVAIERFQSRHPHRSREGIRSQLRLLKAGQEAAKTYGVFDVCGMLGTHPTLTKAKEAAKNNALETGRETTVAALICSFEVEQKIIEKTY